MDKTQRELAKLRLAFEALAEKLERSDVALLPLPQAAKRLGVSVKTLRRRIRDGLVFPKEWGGRLYIPSAEIERVAVPDSPKARRAGRRSARKEAEKLRAALTKRKR